MLKWIKQWKQKREDTKFLRYSMRIFRSIYSECGVQARACLAKTVLDIVRDYGEKWDPELAQFYYDEVHKIIAMNKGFSV